MKKVFLILISVSLLLSCNLVSKNKVYKIEVKKAMLSYFGGYDKIEIDELKVEKESDSLAYEYGVMAYYSRLVVAKQMEAETGTLLYETLGFTVYDENGNDIKDNLTLETINRIEERVRELNSNDLK